MKTTQTLCDIDSCGVQATEHLYNLGGRFYRVDLCATHAGFMSESVDSANLYLLVARPARKPKTASTTDLGLDDTPITLEP